MKLRHIEPFAEELKSEFHLAVEAIRDAVMRRASFNILHLDTAQKVDVFLLKREFYPLSEMERRSRKRLAPDATEQAWFASPEDTILAKFDWYRLGGGVSDRQWGEVTGVMKVQATSLDRDYLHHWAGELRLTELRQCALEESGLA